MRQNKFLNWLVFDWPVKIISLLVAVLLFFFVQLISVEHRSFQVPLTVVGNDSLVIDTAYPEMVDVEITGDQADVFSVYPEDISAFIDISGITEEGTVTVPVRITRGLVFETIGELQVIPDPSGIRIHLAPGASL